MLQNYLLLSFLVIFWSINIIFTKIALNYISPTYLTFFRLSVAAIVMFLFLRARNQLSLPTRKDLPLILSIGLFQMGLFQVLISIGMLYVQAGRAAMLIYSTPLWVTPIAALFFQEKITFSKLSGLILGIAGLFILFNPMSFDWSDSKIVIGNGLLLLASWVWGIVMLHTRFGKWHRSPLELAPWQLLVSLIPPLLFIPTEAPSVIQWNKELISILLYSSLIATAFGMWASTTISKKLSVVVTSLSLLAVPAFSLILSVILLDETLTVWNFIATLLIMGGVGCIGLEGKLLKLPIRKQLRVQENN